MTFITKYLTNLDELKSQLDNNPFEIKHYFKYESFNGDSSTIDYILKKLHTMEIKQFDGLEVVIEKVGNDKFTFTTSDETVEFTLSANGDIDYLTFNGYNFQIKPNDVFTFKSTEFKIQKIDNTYVSPQNLRIINITAQIIVPTI